MADAASSKRRRGLGVVTANACTECRKKRAKCDGEKPCGRCSSQKDIDCVYEVPVRQSKEHMRTEIDLLRQQQRQSERVLAALVSIDRSDEVLSQLRHGDTIESITSQLDRLGTMSKSDRGNVTTFARNSDHQAIGHALEHARNIPSVTGPVGSLQGVDLQQYPGLGIEDIWVASGGGSHSQAQSTAQTDPMAWTPEDIAVAAHDSGLPLVGVWHQKSGDQSPPNSLTQYARDQGQETILGRDFGLEDRSNPESPIHHTEAWTSVTSDSALVDHLMALYFCWEYPTFASLNKEYFLADFKRGRQRYCSSLLVNTILSLGCRFSTQPNTRTNTEDTNSAGDHFFDEAVRLLNTVGDRHTLTTIQALGLMSIREASRGRSSESLYYSGQSIRLAVEMGLHSQTNEEEVDETEHEVRAATFWGAFSLDQAWSLSVGRLPHFSQNLGFVDKPAIIEHVEASHWLPYTDDGAPFERSCTQPSNVRSVFKTFCELSEIVHKALYSLHTPTVPVTSKTLLMNYTNFLNWYDCIPTALKLGHNFTPAVLFAHLYYHYAILLLFRPFTKLDIIGSGISPRDVCCQAADAITTLVHSYSELYTLRRTPSFVPLFVLTSSIAHIVNSGTSEAGPKSIHDGLKDLKEMTLCHGFAHRAIDILHYLGHHWNVDLLLGGDSEEAQDFKKLCGPSSISLNQFCPWAQDVDPSNYLNPVVKDENPLFWPFPYQGRPILASGPELEKAGFKALP